MSQFVVCLNSNMLMCITIHVPVRVVYKSSGVLCSVEQIKFGDRSHVRGC